MPGQQVERDHAAAGLVCLDNRVDDRVAVLLAGLKDKRTVLRIRFFRNIIQADLLDLELVADRFDARQRAVELGEHRVDPSGCEHRLGGIIVACMTVEHLGIVCAAQLQILTDTGASDQFETFCTCRFRLFDHIRLDQAVL